ncbi:MAG: hypothetical protein IT176_09950 [Acidobacteria bacterium]|nr:hypothetical protein [Acidobacteriota bacterium]
MRGMGWSIAAALALAAGATEAGAQAVPSGPLTAEQKQWRYEVGVMEGVLEGAVEHGAELTRDRLQSVLPAQMLLAETARARGFRLAGYGVFFDVEVPPLDGTLDGTLLWTMRTLDQNDLGLQSALKALKAYVESANDPSLQRALERVELQVAPATAVVPLGGPAGAASQRTVGAAAPAPAGDAAPDPILADPIGAYHTEVMRAIMDVMLEHGGALAIGEDEWLSVAVRRYSDGPRLAAGDDDSRTFLARISGAALRAFRSGAASKQEALARIEVRVF